MTWSNVRFTALALRAVVCREEMEGVLDEDYSAVLDTAATTAALENDTLRTENDDSKSISSTASHKKPLYKRAWRKVCQHCQSL